LHIKRGKHLGTEITWIIVRDVPKTTYTSLVVKLRHKNDKAYGGTAPETLIVTNKNTKSYESTFQYDIHIAVCENKAQERQSIWWHRT
jgi:hypothetical protein